MKYLEKCSEKSREIKEEKINNLHTLSSNTLSSKILKLVLILSIFLIAVILMNNLIHNLSEQKEQLVQEYGPKPYVLFCQTENCTSAMLDFMDSANEKLYCAFYDLDLIQLKEKLQQKSKIIDVKLFMDDANYINYTFSRHDEAGPLMHNKFCVADGGRILTGSFNPTFNGAYRNDNNLIIINSKTLAANYEDEFNELWNYDENLAVKIPQVLINSNLAENYFCPDDNCDARIAKALYSANKSIYILAFSFTSSEIAVPIAAKAEEGVEVKGVFEKRNNGEYSQCDFLNYHGADIREDGNKYNMHHKVFIIDNQTVVTGSMNPTGNGNSVNDENILIIHNPEIAGQYALEFWRVWNAAESK